jgi:hypothetical protein
MTTVLISGSRYVHSYRRVESAFKQQFAGGSFRDVKIISGDARGVDESAEKLARVHGLEYEMYEAEWDKHGKAAGPIRNSEMVEDADMLIAIWDGESSGTKDTIEKALRQGLEVHVYQYAP